MESPLDTLRARVAAVDDARVAVNRAILEAREAGESVVAIADAAGLTRQRVYQILAADSSIEARMRARLAELDAKYEALVDSLAAGEGKPGDYRALTARQNAANGKSLRRGRGTIYKSVSVQLRNLAESKLLAVLEHRGDEPVVQAIRAELDEAATLRKRLSTLDETRVFGEVI